MLTAGISRVNIGDKSDLIGDNYIDHRNSKEKKLVSKIVILTFVFVIITVFPGAEGQPEESADTPRELKWAHVYDPNDTFHQWALWSAEEIEKRTDGRYTVEVFPASSLGPEADIVEGLSLGTIDIVYTGAAFIANTYGPIGIAEAPYVFRDYDHWKAFSKSDFFDSLADGYQDASGGHKIASVTYFGARNVTSNRPINTPADMRGLKIRVPNAPLYLLFTESVGANAAPLAFSEVYLALQQGVVDAQENPMPFIRSMKFYEVQDYINVTQHIFNNVGTIIGSASWNSFSDTDKDIFVEVMREAAARNSDEVNRLEGELVPWFRDQGILVNQDVERTAFMNAVRPSLLGPRAVWDASHLERLESIR